MSADQFPNPKPRHRWFHLTPGRFLFGLLVLEGFLVLSERFCWIAFNEHKGWTVLIAEATVGLAVLFLFLWFTASLMFRWRFQFSIRSLLLLTVVIAIPSSWFAVKMQQAKRQREAVEVIRKSGGTIYYKYQASFSSSVTDWSDDISGPLSNDLSATFIMRQAEPPGPVWLRDFLGIDFVSDVVYVEVDSLTDDGIKYLQYFPRVHSLILLNSNISDAGLNYLVGLTQLYELDLRNTKVTNAGIKYLQNAFPNLGIDY